MNRQEQDKVQHLIEGIQLGKELFNGVKWED